jgi:hypothetical protein
MNVLIVSYFPPNTNGSMALWTKDKLDTLIQSGHSVDLITSPAYHDKAILPQNTYFIHSINPTTYLREIKSGQYKLGYFWIPLVFSFGIIHEVIERVVLKRIGDGMWGWTYPILIKMIILNSFKKYDYVVSLGGPTSSHVSTALISRMFKVKTIIEFQDPIVGDGIGHNSRSAKLFRTLEKLLVKSRSKIVFVTKTAAEECQSRHPRAQNISFVYSSSGKILNHQKLKYTKSIIELPIKIFYFGEMYSTRNYNSLFLAMNILMSKGVDLSFEADHYGSHNLDIIDPLPETLKFDVKPRISRENGMKIAMSYDLLLIVQHTDNRSKLTIPYKTWDYLNLQKPILALLNNDELKMLLDGLGHYTCNVNDVDSIVGAILRFAKDHMEDKVKILPNPYDINEQVLELLS